MVKLLPNSVAICVTLSYNTEMLLRQLQLLKGNIMRFNPESKTFAKYNTKQECEQALAQIKEEYNNQKKKIAATCTLTIK